MVKKKEIKTNSVALFGEEIVEKKEKKEKKKEVKKNSSKPTKSSSKSDLTKKTNKLTSKKNSSKSDKEIKKNDTGISKSKSSSNRKNSSSNSSTNSNSKRNSTKEKVQKVSVSSKRGSDNSSKERGNLAARNRKDIQTTSKGSRAASKSVARNPENKRNPRLKDESKERKSSGLRKSVETVEDKASKSRATEQDTPRQEQTAWGNLTELRKEAKKSRKTYSQTERINYPQIVQWGPSPIKDDFSLVEIIVDGKMKIVSAWSVKNGMYYEGLDSEFLVNCLKYGSEENDKDLEEANSILGTKYKTWDKVSAHKKLPENVIMKFGSKLDWSILFKNNDMNKYSKKLKKKYSAEYSSAVALS